MIVSSKVIDPIPLKIPSLEENNWEENNNKDCQLKVQSFKCKNAFMVSVGFSSSGCGVRSCSPVLKSTSKKF